MDFDKTTGTINLTAQLQISPATTRAQLLQSHSDWEEWTVVNNVAMSFRTILTLPESRRCKKVVLIVNVGGDDMPIAFWSLGAWDLIEGPQSRPEGKYTKRMRQWFEDSFNVRLPASGPWGLVEASYDHWNQTSMIVCNYRQRFKTEAEWNEFKSLNKF